MTGNSEHRHSRRPKAGEHNFFRGASPEVYSHPVYEALEAHKSDLPTKHFRALWKQAKNLPVWIYGDVAPGNLQGLDKGTIDRARGWALWKALIIYTDTNKAVAENAKHPLKEIIIEFLLI